MLPDVDIFFLGSEPTGEFLYHRGITHSLAFAPLAGAALGLLAWRRDRPPGRGPRDWIALFVLSMLTHPLLDACTSYGTQLLSPFSRRRFAIDSVAIID